MPEYLAPGVYVEEVSFRSKSIEGVSTTTTGFVGPTRYGPLYDTPDILTCLSDYEAVYGDGQPLQFGDETLDNFMWQAARAYFTEGGQLLYVKRIFRGTGVSDPNADQGGRASGSIGPMTITARQPGVYGDFHVSLTLSLGQNVLASQAGAPLVRGVSDTDVAVITQGSPPSSTFASAESYLDAGTGQRTWRFHPVGSPPSPIELATLNPSQATVQIVTATVAVAQNEPGAMATIWSGLPLDPNHQLGGTPDSICAVFDPTSVAAQGTPIMIDPGDNATGLSLLQALISQPSATASPPAEIGAELLDPTSMAADRTIDLLLIGGSDGDPPQDADYEGVTRPDDTKTGLVSLEDLDDIAIVAAPGSTFGYSGNPDQAHAIINGLIAHAEKMSYRIAVIDAGNGMSTSDVRAMRAQFDSSWAAFYYPWIQILDPISNEARNMPPSGFVAGIYARNDINRAVYKAPANEVVNLAIGFEKLLNKGQQEVLNPEGVNCFRFFEGRGYRLWGARTMSSDPEWKYVNLRRYFAFLEHSVDQGTQWAVFEPNGERLWATVKSTLDDFLFEQWQSGALLGDKPEQAYFVRCDRSTMSQNDLDNGRLVCLIGVAPLSPAEFVIFRIGQWTASATS
jgi:phage tail sheath protein FI